MATTPFDHIRLGLYETRPILPVRVLTPGTYTIPLFIEGNSLLSSIYVRSVSAGGSVKVNYYDFGPGNNDLPGERYELQGHLLIDASDVTDRILVTKVHNKPHAEMIVTGTVEFGIYVTVVASFASDLETNLKLQGQLADILKDKGLPSVGYDSGDGKYYFLPLDNGAVKVTGTVSAIAGGKALPASRVVELALANTEYSIAFVTNVKKFSVYTNSNAVLKCSWQSGESDTEFFPVSGGAIYTEENLIAANLTLYLQSNKPSTSVHVIEWS